MLNLKILLQKGYLPKELPHPFNSESFGNTIASLLPSLPKAFGNNQISISGIHNLARSGALRRKLSVPNPINFFQLSKYIVEQQNELNRYAAKSKISLTIPSTHTDSRAINPSNTLDKKPIERAKVRSTSRFILKADISRFYPSVYTHSIPWAIHTKQKAKANRKLTLIGNKLDLLIRNAQDGQTVGIPIGPDPSLLIAEIILGAVDDKLTNAIKRINALRYIDDYEFGCQSYSEAENILGILEEELNIFELSLNPRKTAIVRLPNPLESYWVAELRKFKFRTSRKGQESDIIQYFDIALTKAKDYPDEGVLKYAISRISSLIIIKENWPLFQHILAQCCLIEPGAIKFILNQIAKYQAVYKIDKDIFTKCLNEIIMVHAPLGHGSEVAWAIWSLSLFKLRIHLKTAKTISAMDDPIVALLALAAKNKGLVPTSQTFDHFASHMTKDDLYGDHWLLAYEARIKRWLPSTTSKDYINSDPCFKFLKDNHVSFFDETLTIDSIRVKPTGIMPGGAGGGHETY